ncbi:MAG: acylneuraminate cytidylyltransferase family protein [Parcubacteria group bacterium]|nr:acylneuraminate cytidylyltransferase family protein [Parcubacteria group bacterium]
MAYKNKKILGVITARGGSKGIPGKNIKELGGKPLIAHTIEAAKKSALLTRCIVSTDDENIAEISREYGADIPFMRPAELAQDNSTSMEVVQHALETLTNDFGEEYDYLMILQPTSPLRTADDIDACIRIAVDTDAGSVMSMKELDDFSPKKMKKIENGVILPYFEEQEGKESSRRQDLSKMYKRNCAIYLTKTECIRRGDLFGKISRAYLMPEERSVDINKPIDFELAEFFLKRQAPL